MKEAEVLYNGIKAGTLSKDATGYMFIYDPNYLETPGSRPISLTLPLRKKAYESKKLFPAFINRLSEGANKRMQTLLLKIDENDYFSLLLATAGKDSIGPVTIKEIT